MAWLPTGLTAIVVCDHRSVKPTGVRAGAGRRGHLPATTAEVRATAIPKVHRHAQVLQCVERPGSAAARGRRLHPEVMRLMIRHPTGPIICLGYPFSSFFNSLKKRQSVPWVMILLGPLLISPASCRRSDQKRTVSVGSISRHRL